MTRPNDEFDDLGRLVSDANDEAIEALFERSIDRLNDLDAQEVPDRGQRSGWRTVVLAASIFAALGAGSLAWWLAPSRDHDESSARGIGQVELSAGSRYTAGQQTTRVRFEDQSTIDIAPTSSIRTREVRPNGASVELEQGRIVVNVEHADDTDWTFSAGPYDVHVTGTSFDLEWTPEDRSFALEMHDGSVRLTGPNGLARDVKGGEVVELGPAPNAQVDRTTVASAVVREEAVAIAASTLVAALEAARAGSHNELAEAEPTSSVAHPEDSAAQATTRRQATPTPGGAETGTRTWRELAGDARFEAAMRQAEAVGFDRLCGELPAEQLYDLADAARYAGNRKRAIQAYEALRHRFAGDELAARAAFDLGVLDDAGSNPASWFQTYLDEQPNGPLAMEAMGRLLESQVAQGERGAARRTAERYLEKYPSGPYARLAHSQLPESESPP